MPCGGVSRLEKCHGVVNAYPPPLSCGAIASDTKSTAPHISKALSATAAPSDRAHRNSRSNTVAVKTGIVDTTGTVGVPGRRTDPDE